MVSTHDLAAYVAGLTDDELETLEWVKNQERERRERRALRQVQSAFVVAR
jgi:hypothetical protein